MRVRDLNYIYHLHNFHRRVSFLELLTVKRGLTASFTGGADWQVNTMIMARNSEKRALNR